MDNPATVMDTFRTLGHFELISGYMSRQMMFWCTEKEAEQSAEWGEGEQKSYVSAVSNGR